ncbi:lipase family protein [Streptomyces sp. NPDC088788]|uniref:lipase family protein n=1 Tax=Streptomyces sp. NPDC088788 TaxID=3365898 RepID=UPI003820362D
MQLKSYPGYKAWHVTYKSTTATGKPSKVTGTVIAPEKATADTPIIGYAPGTVGLGDACAQSSHLETGDEIGGSALIQSWTRLGFAVAITNYEGLDAPGPHPYSVGRSEGTALLDVVRAAQHLHASKLSPSARVGLTGYSQGGGAAAWAAQLAAKYAPDLKVIGAAAGAPPADLRRNVDYVSGTKDAGLELAVAYGYNAAYPELHLDRYLNEKGRVAFKDLSNDCVNDLDSKKWAGKKLSDYTTENVWNRPEWRKRLAENKLGKVAPKFPVLLYNSPQDEIVPVAGAENLAKSWSKAKGNVTFYKPNTGGHVTTAAYMIPVVNGWMTERLLGLPTAGNTR